MLEPERSVGAQGLSRHTPAGVYVELDEGMTYFWKRVSLS